MPQKKYRLEVVLDVRGKKRDQAAQFVAICRQKLADEELELENRKNILADCRRQIYEAKGKMLAEFDDGTMAGNIVAHRNFVESLKDHEQILQQNVETQKINVGNAEQVVEDAVDKLAEASKELKVIETHKGNWKQTQKREFEKKEQKLSDEIGAILHQRSEKL